jgi:hypothetical protein
MADKKVKTIAPPKIGDRIKVKPVDGRTVYNMDTGHQIKKAETLVVDVRILRLLADGDLTL